MRRVRNAFVGKYLIIKKNKDVFFMKNRFIICLILVLGFSCNKQDKYFEQANNLINENKFAEAIAVLDKVTQKYPNYLAAYVNKGFCKSKMGDLQGAASEYTMAIQKDSSYVLAWYNRGSCKYSQKDYNGSIEDFNQALRRKKMFIILPYNNEYLSRSSLKKNTEDVELEPSSDMIRLERGMAYYHIDSLRLAFEDFQYGIDISAFPNDYNALDDDIRSYCYYWRGITYLQMGYPEKGCEDLHKSHELGSEEAMEMIEKYCSKKS
jgi:tetratricopeptide (TPR) repeat protein